MKYYGIDITQYKEFCFSASDADNVLKLTLANRPPFLPAALLPEFRHESFLLTSELPDSRKGLGFLWPSDAQIPTGGSSWENGIGRVPLVTCLDNIKNAASNVEWQFIDSKISWTPHNEPLEFSNSELLGRLFDNITDSQLSCFVIPEEFGESAQENLLNDFPRNVHLIPRSIALALKWCRDHLHEYQNLSFAMQNKQVLGCLGCLSLGFDEWEISLIEIHAVQTRSGVTLVPVYDPGMHNHGLNFCGLALCSLFSQYGSFSSAELWQSLCAKSWFENLLTVDSVNAEQKRKIPDILHETSKTMLPYSKLSIMNSFRNKHILNGDIRQKIDECIRLQQKQQADQLNMLGIAVGGSFAKLKIPPVISPAELGSHNPFLKMEIGKLRYYALMGNAQAKLALTCREWQSQYRLLENLADYLLPQWKQSSSLFVYGPEVFAEGAALAAAALEKHQLSYRIKLIPLELYTIEKDEFRDKKIRWKRLIGDETLDAWNTYQQSRPITGFVIPEGKEELNLTLRRRSMDNSFLYRGVNASISQKTEKKEPVLIKAAVRPGQGFARVRVESAQPGVFATELDWRTMKTVPEPVLRLEYIPNVAFIVSNKKYWETTRNAMTSFVDLWQEKHETDGENLSHILRCLSRWRWDRGSGNVYRYMGAINNDGLESGLLEPELMHSFRQALMDAWHQEMTDKLLRIGGWLYLFIPKHMQQAAEKEIQRGKGRAVYLHIAGLTFYTDDQIRLFFGAFCSRNDLNAEWYRALRNIVRFRDRALSDDVVENEQMDVVLTKIIYNLKNFSTFLSPKIYNNSIEVLIYLLKRRRYDENFLAAGDAKTVILRKLLYEIMERHRTEKYRKIAQETLMFLNKEATEENLTAVLEAAEDGDNDE